MNPSGAPIPPIPQGWTPVFSDDFSGKDVAYPAWQKYSGRPGGDPGGWYMPSHVTCENGSLVIRGYRDGEHWATGGVSTRFGCVQTYGKYVVRCRADRGEGVAIACCLYPLHGWPPEVDFVEDNGADRKINYATLHYGAKNTMVHRQLKIGLTNWHTLGVEWMPGKLVYTVGNRRWSKVIDANVPAVPMILCLQTQAWNATTWEHGIGPTTPANVNLYVDWVAIYERSANAHL